MGKSDKKVKSDRINALRKQYDAFLEEDKRRKERNDYILGRLDKMRYCTAMVPLRHKPTLFIDRRDIDRRDNYSTSSSLSQLNKSSLDIPRQFDETVMLQEISKKYILIPKNRPNIDNDNTLTATTKPAFEENGDWKCKYQILDQLKKREKDSDTAAFGPDTQRNLRNHEIPNFDAQINQEENTQSALGYKYEQPEKDKVEKNCTEVLNQDEANTEQKPYSMPNNQIVKHVINDEQPYSLINNHIEDKHILNENPETYASTNYSLPQNNTEFINNSDQLETTAHFHKQAEPTLVFYPEIAPKHEDIEHGMQDHHLEKYDETVHPIMLTKQEESPVEDKDGVGTGNVYPEDTQSAEVLQTDDLVEQMHAPLTEVTSENIEGNDSDHYPIQTVNVHDFTPGSEVRLQDGVNINPTGYPADYSNAYASENITSTYDHNPSSELVEHIEETADTSGIEAFDEEQREMFYSETTNENYGYNQENVAEEYQQELPVQGTDYSQAETAVYYEGYDAEQAYPVDISEHEEANQRYDPHYEQQYETHPQQEYNQGYEQQAYSHDAQYEGDVNQVQNGLQEFQFEQQHEYAPIENIEQQLDTEQGYNEQIVMGNIEKPIEDLQAQMEPETPPPAT